MLHCHRWICAGQATLEHIQAAVDEALTGDLVVKFAAVNIFHMSQVEDHAEENDDHISRSPSVLMGSPTEAFNNRSNVGYVPHELSLVRSLILQVQEDGRDRSHDRLNECSHQRLRIQHDR